MMSWSRMSFKGQPVWVRVGADQRPVLDSEGRAEMKYRQEDGKSYRPSPSNLAPLAERGEPARAAGRAPPRARAAGRVCCLAPSGALGVQHRRPRPQHDSRVDRRGLLRQPRPHGKSGDAKA